MPSTSIKAMLLFIHKLLVYSHTVCNVSSRTARATQINPVSKNQKKKKKKKRHPTQRQLYLCEFKDSNARAVPIDLV